MFLLSKPLRLRGLKSKLHELLRPLSQVEAFAASWIEIAVQKSVTFKIESKPLRLRGLK